VVTGTHLIWTVVYGVIHFNLLLLH